jgi:hypothetical protein
MREPIPNGCGLNTADEGDGELAQTYRTTPTTIQARLKEYAPAAHHAIIQLCTARWVLRMTNADRNGCSRLDVLAAHSVGRCRVCADCNPPVRNQRSLRIAPELVAHARAAWIGPEGQRR